MWAWLFFPAFFFQILSPPPLSLTWALLFFLNIGLTEACIAIDVPPFPSHGNLTKTPRGRHGNTKLIVRNKVFECTALLKIEVIEYGKNGFLNGLKCSLRDKDFNERGWVSIPLHTPSTSLLAPSVQAFGFQCPPPLRKHSGPSPFCTYISW